MAFAFMKDTALESVLDIPLNGPEGLTNFLKQYQERFLPSWKF